MENKDDSVKSVVDLLTVNTIREKNCVHNVEEQVFVKNMGTEKINAIVFCIHKKFKYSCVECGNGSQLCEHKRRKTECKLCGGKNICEHNR